MMRITSSQIVPRHFGARRRARAIQALRALRHWLHQATDQAIFAQITDLRLNPYLYLSPRC